jgi:hypothetical protein
METHSRQDRQFSQVEDAIGIGEKDDDLVAILFLEAQTPARCALAAQQRRTDTGAGLCLLSCCERRHYKHNIGCAPDKSSLRKLKMNKDEDFRTFALRWRNQAAQVEPLLTTLPRGGNSGWSRHLIFLEKSGNRG